jgi:hypothetical protein
MLSDSRDREMKLAASRNKKSTKKTSKAQTVAVAVLAFTVAMTALYYTGVFDDFQAMSSTQLTPARNLEGTWRTTFPAKFYIKTDFENFGELKEVGSENRTMTWMITKTSDENVVDVEVRFTVSGRLVVADSGYTPDVSPAFLKGTISGTRLTLTTGGSHLSDSRTIGEFSFTTDTIQGSWNDQWSMVYEQEVFTNNLILNRQ